MFRHSPYCFSISFSAAPLHHTPPVFAPVAPLGLNALEGERIALDTTSYMTFSPLSPIKEHYPPDHASTNVAFTDGRGSFGAAASAFTKPKELLRQRLPENFNGVSPLPASYSLKSDTSVSLYRARMENRNVVLRVLKGVAFMLK